MKELFSKLSSIFSRIYGFEEVVEPQQMASSRFFILSASAFEESPEIVNRD